MTRLDLLKIVIARARANGFEFRRWFSGRLGLPWTSAEQAVAILDTQRRYYALLFSHEFAEAFWKAGEDITFQVPSTSFERRNAHGEIIVVQRKPFTRRSVRRDAWRFHLREMALAPEPLRYIRKYLNVQEDLTEEGDPNPTTASAPSPAPPKTPRPTKAPRPLPKDLPAFLKRPYPPKP